MPKHKPSGRVRFHYIQPVRLPGKLAIKEVIREIGLAYNRRTLNLDYIFCDDEYLLSLNRKFLQHDYYTDIVTFDLSARTGEIKGEIYISVDRVRENSRALAVPVSQEFCRVIFHGALHLCGLKDKTKAEMSRMRAAEERFLALLERKLFHVKQKTKKSST